MLEKMVLEESSQDRLILTLSARGHFSCKSFKLSLNDHLSMVPIEKALWRVSVLLKVKIFL